METEIELETLSTKDNEFFKESRVQVPRPRRKEMERRNRIMLLHKDRRLRRVGVARTRTGSKVQVFVREIALY